MNNFTHLKVVFLDFAKRLWIFAIILYGAAIMSEIFRQVFLENLHALSYHPFGQYFLLNEILKELAAKPVLILLPLASTFFSLWGFAALYFSFQNHTIKYSIAQGLKDLARYTGFVASTGILTGLGFGIISVPAYLLLQQSLGIFSSSGPFSIVFSVLFFLILGIPGIYLLVSLSIGPFILLLEGKGIRKAIFESHKRISPRWFSTAIFLGTALVAAGIAYSALSWIMFTLKLQAVGNLSFRGESILRIFLYSIPWVIAVSFFDLAVYHWYRKISERSDTQTSAQKSGPVFPPGTQKTIGAIVLIAFVLTFGLIPSPVLAGNLFSGGILQILTGIVLAVVVAFSCVYAACAAIPLIGGYLAGTATTALALVILQGAASGVLATVVNAAVCDGSYNIVTGSCTYGSGAINIYTGQDVKFLNIILGEKITPEEFDKNQSAPASVKIKWKADAPLGVREYIKVQDVDTGNIYYGSSVRACTNPAQHAQDPSWSPIANDTVLLPYGHRFKSSIDFEMCIQIKSKTKGAEPLCVFGDDGINKLNNWGVFPGPGKTIGCGCDPKLAALGITPCGTLIDTDFVTPKLPVKVDLKANNSDKPIAEKNKPVKLSWSTEYAVSCTASGNWTGSKPVNGSETVVPITGTEVYTLTCSGIVDFISANTPNQASDSIGFNVSSQPQINITNPGSGINFDGGGSLGKLKITEFNISTPLNPGASITINWSIAGATKCEVDNGIGEIPCVGSATVTFVKSTTFTLTGSDSQGNTVSATKTISVKKIPEVREVKPE